MKKENQPQANTIVLVIRTLKENLRATKRTAKNLLGGIIFFCYDYKRFGKYSGSFFVGGPARREYLIVKIYHRLEKSLSFRNRRAGAGQSSAIDLASMLMKAKDAGEAGFHASTGVRVLKEFVHADHEGQSTKEVTLICATHCDDAAEGGARALHSSEIKRGRLPDPEEFFSTRHSIRDFAETKASPDLIMRAIKLAMQTPSACNRQPWHVYILDHKKSIDIALSLQNGNRGFGEEISTLLILTADLRAFDTPEERSQHWIDGGMFSMSLVWALHSLGLGTCCLNWSRSPRDDIKLRQLLPIEGCHSVVMMLAVGEPKSEIKVCASPRRPITEVYTYVGDPCLTRVGRA